jgi:hypothetical protein
MIKQSKIRDTDLRSIIAYTIGYSKGKCTVENDLHKTIDAIIERWYEHKEFKIMDYWNKKQLNK